MAVFLYLCIMVFGSLFLIAYAKKRAWRLSWAWAHPSRLFPFLASPLSQFGLVLALYFLLRGGHTPAYSALMACILTVGAFGLLSLSVRSAVVLYALLAAYLGSRPSVQLPPVPEVAEHPASLAFRAQQRMRVTEQNLAEKDNPELMERRFELMERR